MRLSAVLIFCAATVALARSIPVPARSLVIDTETAVNHVTLEPQKPMDLNAFTLCLRAATDLPSQDRDIILFSYRSQDDDDLNLWREKDGKIGLYMRDNNGVKFTLPPLGPLKHHLCVTWESSTGATSVFFDGKKSLTKFYKKDHAVTNGGQVIIGQDKDGDTFDAAQSFVGEISDINLWSRVIPDSFIMDMADSGQTVRNGDVIDWKVAALNVNGDVHVLNRDV